MECLWVILGPIYVSGNRCLPEVSGEQLQKTVDDVANEYKRRHAEGKSLNVVDEYFSHFKELNPFWHRCIMAFANDLTDDFSRHTVVWASKVFIQALPEELEPSPIDVGDSLLEAGLNDDDPEAE